MACNCGADQIISHRLSVLHNDMALRSTSYSLLGNYFLWVSIYFHRKLPIVLIKVIIAAWSKVIMFLLSEPCKWDKYVQNDRTTKWPSLVLIYIWRMWGEKVCQYFDDIKMGLSFAHSCFLKVVVVVVVSLFSSNVHSRITKYKNTNYMSHVTHTCLRDQWWNIVGGSQGSRSSSSWQPLTWSAAAKAGPTGRERNLARVSFIILE